MSEAVYAIGDLVEVEKKDIASSTRMRGIVTEAGRRNGEPLLVLRAQCYEPAMEWLERVGFTVTVIEKAKPPMPTEPGAYASRTGGVHVLDTFGVWTDHSAWNGRVWPEPPAHYAPFTRLEPVAETAKKVLEAIERVYGENYLNNSDAGWNKVAIEFGVTS